MQKHLIVVAGGKGLRMGGDIPKQFIPIAGRPVLMRTIETFHTYDPSINVVLVLPKEQQAYWEELCCDYAFSIPHRIADGGETRYHSVKNGLNLIEGQGLVAVHDGVRPFVSNEVIGRCYDMAARKGSAIPITDVFETVRQLTDSGSRTVDRNSYKLVQTPQAFTLSLLKSAYNQAYTPSFTDDASVVEAMGEAVFLVEGNRENLKITTPFDLKVANALLDV